MLELVVKGDGINVIHRNEPALLQYIPLWVSFINNTDIIVGNYVKELQIMKNDYFSQIKEHMNVTKCSDE